MNRSKNLVTVVTLLLCIIVSACSDATNTNEVNSGIKTSVNNASIETEEDSSAAVSKETVVQHKYGETTIPTNPSRVVSIGLEDILLSLDLPLVYATLHGE